MRGFRSRPKLNVHLCPAVAYENRFASISSRTYPSVTFAEPYAANKPARATSHFGATDDQRPCMVAFKMQMQ
jgi:hypothetical protein